MTYVPGLHSNPSVLLDTNLLILYLVGSTNRDRIERYKRTQRYNKDDYDQLMTILSRADVCFTTPHILTQVSDLVKLDEPEFTVLLELFRQWVDGTEEYRMPAADLVRHPLFRRVGLADTSIVNIAEQGAVVLTDDFDLYLALIERNLAVINFNHLRFRSER